MDKVVQYILPSLPLIAKIIPMFTPEILPAVGSYIGEFEATFFIYILTVVYAKFRCSNTTLKDVIKKSFIPISLFIGLAIFSIVAQFIRMPVVIGVEILLNNMFVWLGLGFLIYKPLFNKVFEIGKC